ncbi:MAG: hypothetical protein ABR557_12140 [Pyrinomonadaceae bacterium]
MAFLCASYADSRLTFARVTFARGFVQQTVEKAIQPPPISSAEKRTIATFENRLKAYMKLRNRIKEKLPKLSKDSTPEQIESFRKSFEEQMRAARTGVKSGDIFRAGAAAYIRKTLRTEFQGKDRAELRNIVFEAETQGVPLRVNYAYPEAKEFTEMPATLLAKLPPLPKEVRYRFVGRNMLLIDRDNNLIIDYMVDALP